MASQWTRVTFGEVVRLEQGLCFNKKTNYLMAETGIPLLRIADLINNTQTKFVNEEKVPKKFIANPEDIIYSRTGQVGLVFRGKIGVVHNNCFRVIPKEGIERSYVYWYLRQPAVINQARSLAGGAAQPDLSHDAFKSISFSYPEPKIQRKIAFILSAYDDLIENNRRRIKILEEMAQTIYNEWFVKFRFPGHKNVKTIESELGMIPEGWKVVKLGDVADINSTSIKKGAEPSKINYIDISSVSTGVIDKIEEINFVEAPSRARRIVKHGDMIWSTVRPNRKSYSMILNPVNNLIVSTGFAVITPNKMPYTYLYHALTTNEFVGYLVNNATGAAYPAVNSNDFKNAVILKPSNDVLTEFHSKIEPMFEIKHNFTLKNENLKATRDLLLPRLISGEIDVSELDIDVGGIKA